MKKTLKCLFSLFIILNCLFIGVKAEKKDDLFVTDEPTMPAYNVMARGATYTREQWVNDIIEYNEEHFNQEISNWYETEDMYVFEFEPSNAVNTLSITDENGDIYLGIDKIEYIKPESDWTLSVNGTTYVDKFTYYYGFSGRYVQIDSKSKATYKAFRDISIKIASTISFLGGELMQMVTNTIETAFDYAKPASITVSNQYFYYNKVCSIRATDDTTWYPTCQIGKRYAFTLEEYRITYSDGYLDVDHSQLYKWDRVSIPPKAGQFTEPLTKPHYEDGRWMIENAISTKTTGGYVDVYGLAPNPHN